MSIVVVGHMSSSQKLVVTYISPFYNIYLRYRQYTWCIWGDSFHGCLRNETNLYSTSALCQIPCFTLHLVHQKLSSTFWSILLYPNKKNDWSLICVYTSAGLQKCANKQHVGNTNDADKHLKNHISHEKSYVTYIHPSHRFWEYAALNFWRLISNLDHRRPTSKAFQKALWFMVCRPGSPQVMVTRVRWIPVCLALGFATSTEAWTVQCHQASHHDLFDRSRCVEAFISL